MRQADHWYIKGVTFTASRIMANAIQCYKQALQLNRIHFLAMYNIAVVYFKMGKVSSAKKWFFKAIDVEKKLEPAYKGACLACFKLGHYQEAA